ncbi:lysophospholipid acyltransferase family protein [Aliiglaciecola sp. 3_MG-2023]|uniref:lysophospholipid acyltransferase family protein n=1 Tax=Aliiglaciecola sp. 3_MG-2023 TaxID=3062644 RepID=UPI0026E1F0F2|nr:lysophospholipid acyltransferase family protein [Aliiglaciecola sp. 3_MG-2023]MDO6694913.1 lysophospholipid acyltransferase family protein [Aliiglaciecola sp. 3_MG-2023]
MSTSISLVNLVEQKKGPLTLALKLLDRLVGVKKMDVLYKQHQMQGLEKEAFAEKLLEVLNIEVLGGETVQKNIPKSGPLVIASNHPFGGIEGVILCLLIGQIRPDLQVLANQGLKLFPELKDYFIFTNPLSERDPKNTPSIRASLKHVKQGGALLVFPAGRVAYYQGDKKRISEHHWNRIVGKLINASQAHFLPIFVSGQNSPLFYRLGRVYYRFRLLMLARELLNKNNSQVQISCGSLVKPNTYKVEDSKQQAALCRIQSYSQDPFWNMAWPADQQIQQAPLANQVPWQQIAQELQNLPKDQCLLVHKEFSVYYGYQHQLPNTVVEIARLRELVFRQHNEGSGEPIDTDEFDATYTQLFVVNNEKQNIIGAYRMGQTDKLLEQGDISQLYLARMFNFSAGFVNRQQPCLELGRSFLIPEYQKSFQGLFLLWRGIGAFVCKFPHYRTLYGTVSLSKLYNPRSVALIEHGLVTPTDKVTPHKKFNFPPHPEILDFAKEHDLSAHLTTLLAAIESDGKDIPILAKHYLKLGAKFHCLGIDGNFNDTPGLLLSVELPKAPEKLLKLYLGEAWKQYKLNEG